MNALKSRVASPFAAIWVATFLLFVVSPFVASGSLSHAALQGMLPFAGILAVAAIGQTLVIQQGGLDLSVPGIFSMGAVLIVIGRLYQRLLMRGRKEEPVTEPT